MLLNDLIKESIDLNKKIIVAYSGGADSTALLHVLSDINNDCTLDLQAIHINHNLSKKSLDWVNHCKKTCSKLNIELIVESIEVSSDGGGLESAARQERYKTFKNILNNDDQLLLAHHSDDVAETIFMRMLRGTGIDGLEGPKQKRNIGNGILIRPFLSISKKEILLYLTKNKINYIEDESNSNSKFDRNFLRNEIFPLLEKRWKSFPNRINNMSSIVKERNGDYFELINNQYNELIDSAIEIKKLKKISNSVARDILRLSIKKSNLSLPNTKIMNEIIKTFLNSSPGPKSIVSWSRSDREELAGQITFKNGFLIISEDNRRNDES